jgi:hypothetical protein
VVAGVRAARSHEDVGKASVDTNARSRLKLERHNCLRIDDGRVANHASIPRHVEFATGTTPTDFLYSLGEDMRPTQHRHTGLVEESAVRGTAQRLRGVNS